MDGNSNKYRELADRDLQKRLDDMMEQLGVSNETLAEEDPLASLAPHTLKIPYISLLDTPKPKAKRRSSAVHAGHRERLRKSIRRDPRLDGFSDIEILEILLSFVVPQRDTNVIAHRLLDKFGSLVGVMSADTRDLFAVHGMTRTAAELLPGLWLISRGENSLEFAFGTRVETLIFFYSLYLGGTMEGMCMAYLDGSCRLLALEHIDVCPDVSYRAAVSSAIKYGASAVLPVWFGRNEIDMGCDAVAYVRNMLRVLDTVDVVLYDFFMMTDYGFYAPGPRTKNFDGWVPQFVFVPERYFMRTSRLLEVVHDVIDEEDAFEDEISSHSLSAFFDSLRNNDD